jgi:hypothetical protein
MILPMALTEVAMSRTKGRGFAEFLAMGFVLDQGFAPPNG